MQANLTSAINYIQQSQAYKVVMANTNKTNIAIVAASTVLIATGVFFGKKIQKRVDSIDTKISLPRKYELHVDNIASSIAPYIRSALIGSGAALITGRAVYIAFAK